MDVLQEKQLNHLKAFPCSPFSQLKCDHFLLTSVVALIKGSETGPLYEFIYVYFLKFDMYTLLIHLQDARVGSQQNTEKHNKQIKVLKGTKVT